MGEIMGEVSNDILNGIMCQDCGVWMDDMFLYDETGETTGINDTMWENPPGHPRTCADCLKDVENLKKEDDLRNEEY